MTDEYRPVLQKLIKCLQEASDCIVQVPDGNEFKTITIELQSLKLILDGNVDALSLWMDQGGNYRRYHAKFNG